MFISISKTILRSLTLGLLCVQIIATAAEPPRPNILFIVSDDQAFTDYSFMGHPKITTPNLDKLAKESVLFRRGYAPSSLCCPSLSALITGKYPHQTKITGNEPPWKPVPAPPNTPPTPEGQAKRDAKRYQDPAFLAEVKRMNGFMSQHTRLPHELGKLGYVSLQTGKWWAGNYSSGGFTEGMSEGDQTKGGRHGDKGLEIGRKTMEPIYTFVDKAEAQKKPWFVWYAPMLPHDPHTPPEDLLAKYKKLTPSIHVARYWANVEFFDRTCGELLKYLDDKKLAENTVVVYVTDNGWIQQEDTKVFRKDSKLSQYDTGLRTPIMFRWTGHWKPCEYPELASLLDIAPTLYNLLGVKLSETLPGIDLLDDAARAARPALFGECHLHNAVNLDDPRKNLLYRWTISQDGWKYISPNPQTVKQENKPGRGLGPELYNLTEDSLEEKNRFAEDANKARAGEMQAKLDAWWSQEK